MATCGASRAWASAFAGPSALWSGHGAGSARVSPARPSQSTSRAVPRADRPVAGGVSSNLGSSISMTKPEKLPSCHSGRIFRTVFLQALSDQESCWKSLGCPASRGCSSAFFLCETPEATGAAGLPPPLSEAVGSGVSLGGGSAGLKFK